MKCIRSTSHDPYFNLAAEEYLLKQFQEEYYFQYVNDPSVGVGKHQNALAEIDLDFLEKEGIRLARRISGGGAVYHDPGNLNYAFITEESPGDFVKFSTYTAPIIAALRQAGIQAHLGKRNELLTGDKKISGTASHVFKTRVLHHGTLLFDADLQKLSRCLYVEEGRYRDKAVRSVRSEVVNLQTLLAEEMDDQAFYHHIFHHILESDPGNKRYDFTDQDLEAIKKLVNEKFSTWEWIYGYSPKYEIERDIRIQGVAMHVRITVSKGVMDEVAIFGTGKFDPAPFLEVLKGTRHNREIVSEKLRDLDWTPEQVSELVAALF